MQARRPRQATSFYGFTPFGEQQYGNLHRRTIVRLLITYLAPLIALAGYFYFQYHALIEESRRLQLQAIAENQANTLDLFVTERLINLSNLIDDPRFDLAPAAPELQDVLAALQKISSAFVDIGYVDSSGVQAAYAGPYSSPEKRDFRFEPWYVTLRSKEVNFIVSDIYPGFRQQPHFAIAVSRIHEGQFIVLRATLSLEKVHEFISGPKGSTEVFISIVNKAGSYQAVTPHITTPLETSSIVPPVSPRLGTEVVTVDGAGITYAYSWLRSADWALMVQWSSRDYSGVSSLFKAKVAGISLLVILIVFFVIIKQARKLAQLNMECDRHRAQLEHASKLASVGELAAGIAHELNNPLAVIGEEAALMKDLMNPEFGRSISDDEAIKHLDTIGESVSRCRDITRKLLNFVRTSAIDMQEHDIHRLINGVVDDLLGHEMVVSNIEIVKQYGSDIPTLVTDGNQLQQVFLNIINNGVDAITGAGKITISTSLEEGMIRIAISDTGKGISADALKKIFLPFYTTKEVGKGTGLGLSVSYGIIKNLGGDVTVDSTPGVGSTFTIKLPIRPGQAGI